jgi:hypothetical protein
MKLIATLSIAIRKMMAASVTCPTTIEISTAMSRMMTSGFTNRTSNSIKSAPRLRGEGSFRPTWRRRASASH